MHGDMQVGGLYLTFGISYLMHLATSLEGRGN